MEKLSEYFNNLSITLEKKATVMGEKIDKKVNALGKKIGYGLEKTDTYLVQKIEGITKEWNSISPVLRKDIKKGAIGASVALITPLYIAIPAGVYAYKKGRKLLKIKVRKRPSKE